MKKIFFFGLCFIFFFGCSKKENVELAVFPDANTVELVSTNAKETVYLGTVQLGHSSSGCSGCVNVGGTCVHFDCTGYGNACTAEVSMKLASNGDTSYSITILNPDGLTYEDVFLMPDRSLYVIGSSGEFLNIPEQMTYRDDETGTFTFYDVFFSDSQMFGNK
ncbi:MAG: hypothetical protein FWC10_06395 [Lentimicrobiaceae bacterium]|nr:hypothetical protein [Lentimicrobiaceae bacterium]